jgi:hypothetical protein
MQQLQQPQQQLPARTAIEYTCRLLRSYGVEQLTPELIRQAKFDTPTVSEHHVMLSSSAGVATHSSLCRLLGIHQLCTTCAMFSAKPIIFAPPVMTTDWH